MVKKSHDSGYDDVIKQMFDISDFGYNNIAETGYNFSNDLDSTPILATTNTTNSNS